MKLSLCRRLLAAGIIYWFSSSPVFAENAAPAWQSWLKTQIESHPDIISARQTLNAQLSLADGHTQPLYNPQLETEFEREGDADNYRIGINQTLDVWGKRTNRRQQAEFLRLAAEQSYAQTYQDKLTEALSGLATYQASKTRFLLAKEQEQQIDILLQLVKDRQEAGDLGQIDVNFSLASLAQRLNETAKAMADFRAVETRVRELFPNLPADKAEVPAQLIQVIWQVSPELTPDSNSPELLDVHPTILLAKAQWDIQKVAADLASLESKTEPTLGINAGKEGDEDIVGLTLSLPLNIRNDFSAEKRAATEQALSAEAAYRAVRRKQQFQIQAAASIAQQYKKQLLRWQVLIADTGNQGKQLLEQQWRSGDLSTNDYLLALQQNMAGTLAGIELQEKFQLAVIDWLKASGQVKAHILPAQNQI